jgi:hypothetical protein
MSCESEVFEILETNQKSKDPLLNSYINDAREQYEKDMLPATNEDFQERFAFQYHVTALHIQTGNIPRLLRQYYDKHRHLIDTLVNTKSPEEIEAYIEDYRNPQPEELTPEIAA